jgi:hypothetical protein
MNWWLQVVWNRKPRVLLKNKNGMLMLDAFKGHLRLAVKSVIHAKNTDCIIISGMSSKIQVLVNISLMDHLKQSYSQWSLARDHVLTQTGTTKKLSVELLCWWIKISW